MNERNLGPDIDGNGQYQKNDQIKANEIRYWLIIYTAKKRDKFEENEENVFKS